MNILMAIPMLGYSGAPKVFAWLSNVLSKKHQVKLVVVFQSKIEQNVSDNVDLIQLNEFYENNAKIHKKVIRFIKTEIALIKMIKTYSPDLIISFGDIFTVCIIPLIKKMGIKVLVSERGDPNVSTTGARIRKQIFYYADYIVFQTEGARELFKTNRINSRVIFNPISIENNLQIPFCERSNVISFVGRFEIKQKRQDIMIRAFSIIHNLHPEYNLVFYGDGEDFNKCMKMVEEYNLNDCVVFCGRVNNVIERIRHTKIFVLTSDYEGIPNALIEAMSVCIPVVTTNCKPGGAKMLIKNGYNGYIVPIGDYEGIADRVCYLISNPCEADLLGERAFESLKRFNPDLIAEQWLEVIDSLF